MSLNVGEKRSRYVAVSNVTMRFEFSERVLFADLRTSRKTGNPKVNKETGAVMTDEKGNPVPERVYTYWEGRFVGNAFEPAKTLRKGQTIDIVNGWVDKDYWTDENGKRRENVYVVITDFELPDANDEDEDAPSVEDIGKDIDSVSDVYRSLNGDDGTPVKRAGN